MAVLVLQAAGAALGGLFGAFGSTIGMAAGALGGYLVDRALISSTQHIEGARLSSMNPMSAEEGAPLPRIYGVARVSGTLIWATRFQEVKSTSRQGAKGGPKVSEYSYFANAAIAVADGEIAGIRRIWADGKELDQTQADIRIYRGAEDQQPDPLIEVKQGAGNAPAYRGTAYVVLDRLPIDSYGNRLPQFQFEVLRPVSSVASTLKAVALIPGSTEFGLSPDIVRQERSRGETVAVNRNTLTAKTDWNAALDELQALCPQLRHVAIVVPWFGNDLRAGHCRIRPGVTTRSTNSESRTWRAGGIGRDEAHLISTIETGVAYGGSPSDQSVIDAIRDARNRNLKVTLYPFVMMDIPSGNALPDPYGGASQAAYPWRGRITCHPAAGMAGSVDQSGETSAQIRAFVGGANDWGYGRFVRHMAQLAVSAGGVDAFVLGSEMRGLTTVRGEDNRFPFVENLCDLAGEVRSIVGGQCKLTYAADWSEYFGFHPQDGSGDVFFHLDPLWAHPAIDAIGIDNYMPLSDWRDEDYSGANPDGFAAPYDGQAVQRQIAGGEGFDWYYASDADRMRRLRSPITDGLAGKTWVFRYKDLQGWWGNRHFNRIGGVEQAEPTAWLPQSKPIWFTELGCPAADKGPNQPNVFPDPKSSENAIPHFSDGGRSDLAQSRFLQAHLDHWNSTANPVSPLYDGRMVDSERIYGWAWDTRPFPEFPLNRHLWADGDNWRLGHWLNGRLTGAPLDDLIAAIFRDYGLPVPDAMAADGFLAGYMIDEPMSARAALEPLLGLFRVNAFEAADALTFASEARTQAATPLLDIFVEPEEGGAVRFELAELNSLPGEIEVFHRDPLRDYQSGKATATVQSGQAIQTVGLPGMMENGQALALGEDLLRSIREGRRTASFDLSWRSAALSVGDTVRLRVSEEVREFVIVSIEDGATRRIEARALLRAAPTPEHGHLPSATKDNAAASVEGKPVFYLVDLPCWPGSEEPAEQFRIAAFARPWRGASVFASPEQTGFAGRSLVPSAAVMGELVAPLTGGAPSGRIAHDQAVEVKLYAGELHSVTRVQMLNGANTGLLRSPDGNWEIFQFRNAVEVEPDLWLLTELLRGQAGTEMQAASDKPEGAAFILLDEAVLPAGLKPREIGLELQWRVGAPGRDFSDEYYTTVPATGGLRALAPLPPAHIKAERQPNGDLAFRWIRRGRIGADDWLGADIPLGEAREAYRVEIRSAGVTLRVDEVDQPGWTYGAAARQADFGNGEGSFEFAVAMLSERIGAGVFARRVITV
ncbi:MAG: baseplate multidomain protein megatron [Phyllobacterium sp.]